MSIEEGIYLDISLEETIADEEPSILDFLINEERITIVKDFIDNNLNII